MESAGKTGQTTVQFKDIFISYYPAVFKQAAYILGNSTAAEDVAQETFIKLYRTPPREQTNLGGWLARVATNLAYNYLRSEKSRKRRENSMDDQGTAWAPTEESALRNEEIRFVHNILDKLPERDRMCLLLRHSGASYAEIARIAGVKPGSVGTILARSQVKFRKEYNSLKGRKF